MNWNEIQPLVTCIVAAKALTGSLDKEDALECIYIICNQPTMRDAVTVLVHAPSTPAGTVALQEITRLTPK